MTSCAELRCLISTAMYFQQIQPQQQVATIFSRNSRILPILVPFQANAHNGSCFCIIQKEPVVHDRKEMLLAIQINNLVSNLLVFTLVNTSFSVLLYHLCRKHFITIRPTGAIKLNTVSRKEQRVWTQKKSSYQHIGTRPSPRSVLV